MGVGERRARHKEALRQRILEAAREVFIKEGYDNVSMRKIAARIEYSPTTIYLYFKDKGELLNCLCEEIHAAIADLMDRALKQEGDPIARLRKGLRAYVEFGMKCPQDYRVAFLIQRQGYLPENSIATQLYNRLRGTVQEAIAQQKLRPADVETVTQCLWAATHGITSLLVVHPDFPWVDRESLIEMSLDSAIRGWQ